MGKPLVSVLLPARDAAATLPACLASLRRQTLGAWECVLVDDGSRDATPDLARAAAATDPRIRPVRGPGRGLVAALETGLAACRAPVVARMDADDWMHRERLAAQCSALAADPTLSGVGSRVRLFPRRGLGAGARAYEQWLNGLGDPASVREAAFVECPIAHPTLAVRRAVLERFGYRALPWPEDYDLVLRLLAAGHRLAVVPRRLLAWRQGPGRLQRTHPRYGIDRFTACKAAFLADGFLAGDETYGLWGYGGTGRALRRALLAHGKRPAHIVELHPGRLGQRIHGAPVVPPDALPALPRRPLVVSVAGATPRARIRGALERMGFRSQRDYVLAA